MRRSTAMAAAIVALLIAASAVLANDGPGIAFTMTAQEVTAEQAKELAVQIARSTARRRPGVERPVLVPRHRPLPLTDVARAPAAAPTASPTAAPAQTTQPQPAATTTLAPTPVPRSTSPARRTAGATSS